MLKASTHFLMKKILKFKGAIALMCVALLIIITTTYANQPKDVYLKVDTNSYQEYETKAKTVQEFLEERNYDVSSLKVNVPLENKLLTGMELDIATRKEITVNHNAKSIKSYNTNKLYVKEFIEEQGIEYDDTDVLSHKDSDVLKDGMNIQITIYDEVYREEEEITPFETEVHYDFEKNEGDDTVEQEGENGVTISYYKDVYRGGRTPDTTPLQVLLRKEKTKEVKNEIITKGSKRIETEDIPYDTEERTSADICEGDTNVVQYGSVGTREIISDISGKNETTTTTTKEPQTEIIEYGTADCSVYEELTYEETSYQTTASSSSYEYSLSDFQYAGVINWGGYKYTYYSQSVLPGGGLRIPGRHVSDLGYVTDGDGYIVLAANVNIPKGSVFNTPFGAPGKVYDTCGGCSMSWLDVYTK